MTKILITTVPFGEKDPLPLNLLKDNNIDYLINPKNKKLTENELAEMVSDFDAIIAGTEPITKKVMDAATNLKMISRVGIGLDNVDLLEAKKQGITVSYTPDAPAPAVAELTIGLMLSLLRFVHVSNTDMHYGKWQRIIGRRLSEVTIGIIGMGRIGTRVLKGVIGLGTRKILVNDINPNMDMDLEQKLEWTTKKQIYMQSDIISLHVPMLVMKQDAVMFT
jgi:D-3-phosphoglycerate dehydrogenase / 2-oxoglutarate reductase